jgi:hypothetical protein
MIYFGQSWNCAMLNNGVESFAAIPLHLEALANCVDVVQASLPHFTTGEHILKGLV